MRRSEFTTSWPGHPSISPTPPRPRSRQHTLGNSRKRSKSKPTPAHTLSSYSSTTSPQHSDEQDSDGYIIDHSHAFRLRNRPSIQQERMSSFDTPPTVRSPQPSSRHRKTQDMHNHLHTHCSDNIPASRSSVGSSSLRDLNTSNPRPKPFPFHDVIELDDDEEEEELVPVSRNDVIEISSDSDEEMNVNNMLTTSPSPEPEPSSSRVPSSQSLSDLGDSLFTPPPSRTRRRRVILDHVLVPPLPKGLAMTDYRSSSDVSLVDPHQGVEYPSVGDALTAAFAQNHRLPSPSLDRKGKGREREREATPPALVCPQRNKSLPLHFGEGISTLPTTILDACYPPIELEISDFVPYFADTWHRSTYWIERVRFKRHHAELHQGLQEMIAQTKCPSDRSDKQDDSPILPRVFAPLFERRPDIAASLAAQWGDASSKHSAKGKSTNILEAHNIPSSSNCVSPAIPNDDRSASHFDMLEEGQPLDLSMEMDQYWNDFGYSPPKLHLSGTKYAHAGDPQPASNSYCNLSNLTGFLHDTTQLPPDVAIYVQDNAVDGFLGIPPSPKDLSSPLQYTSSYPIDDSHALDDNFGRLFPEKDKWPGLPDLGEECISPKTVSPPESADTIDPSLLGGNEPPPKLPSSPIIPPPNSAQKKRMVGPIIYVRRPPGVSASQDAPAQGTMMGKSRRNVQIKYRTSGWASPVDKDNVVSNKDAAKAVNDSETRRGLKIRIRRSGTHPSTDGSFVPSQQSSTSASPAVSSTPLPNTKRSKAQEPTPAPPTPQSEPEDSGSSFCHHCRRTTMKPKMQCSKRRQDRQICGKLFCDRCILNRYPDISFDRLSKKFVCPVCTDTCNCSQCARKRGEEYISMRGGGFAGLRAKSGILLLPDAAKSNQVQDVQTTPEPLTGATFWAHVYDFEGDRVGRAFIGDAPPTQPAKGRVQSGLSKSKSTSKPKPIAKPKTKKPRVFIGPPLREWKVRTFRDLEPSAPIPPLVAEEGTDNGKGKGKAVERPRVYIGDAKWLNMPYARMPASPRSSRTSSPEPGEEEQELDSDGSLTSLEDLEDAMDWPRPDVGEAVTVTWGPTCERNVSARLTPDDVEKAIGVALAAARDGCLPPPFHL